MAVQVCGRIRRRGWWAERCSPSCPQGSTWWAGSSGQSAAETKQACVTKIQQINTYSSSAKKKKKCWWWWWRSRTWLPVQVLLWVRIRSGVLVRSMSSFSWGCRAGGGRSSSRTCGATKDTRSVLSMQSWYKRSSFYGSSPQGFYCSSLLPTPVQSGSCWARVWPL